jgi:hypothetical protein
MFSLLQLFDASRIVENQQDHGQQAGRHHMQVRFPKDAVMHICRNIMAPIWFYIWILFCFMRPISLSKKNENIHRLNSLANMDRSFELWGRWSQIIILTTSFEV